jgi:hypothetical protein
MKINVCNFEDNFFDDKSIIVKCTLNFKNEYKIKAMINNDCIDYFFIDINIAHKMCESLNINSLKLNKSREVKKYDERRSKNIIHAIYSFMIIQDHTKSFISMMIIKFDQHSIILKKSWMKKHNVNYHDHDDSISFYFDHCSHLEASKHSYSNQKTKKKVSFRKRNFLDQSKMKIESIENKEIKIFLEKNNNSKTILKKSIEFSKTLIKRRRINESWRKKLRKIKTSLSKVLRKRSKINSFYDEMKDLLKEKIFTLKSDSVMKIHSIAAASFNILFR